MFELNVLTAVPLGALAAAIWSIVSIRRLLRKERFGHFTGRQRLVVWCAAGIAFVPALFVAFAASVVLTKFTVYPGAWNHLQMALTVVFGLGILGLALTWAAARATAGLIGGRNPSENAV